MAATVVAFVMLVLFTPLHQQSAAVKTYSVTGRVIDGTTGGSINGAVIVFWDRSASRLSGRRTPVSNGTFVITNVTPGQYTIAAEVPIFDAHQIWYPIGVVALTAAARAVDQLLAGPLPLQRGAPLQKPSGRSGWLRFALAFTGAAMASMWIGNRPDRVHAIWIVTTTIVVMLPDATASYRRIFGRVFGTFAGVVAAWVITSVFDSAAVICIAILVIAPLIPHHHANRYWLHTGLIALMVLLAYDLTLLNSPDITKLLTQRLEDILLGCMIALVGTVAAFPHEVTAALNSLIGDSHKGR